MEGEVILQPSVLVFGVSAKRPDQRKTRNLYALLSLVQYWWHHLRMLCGVFQSAARGDRGAFELWLIRNFIYQFADFLLCPPMDLLPSYAPSCSPPLFSTQPGQGEQSLLHTEGISTLATGTFTRQCGNTTVTLTEQEEDTLIPVYPQRGIVAGSVNFQNSDHIYEVVLKVRDTYSFWIGALNSMFSSKDAWSWV